jgi:hypothetical protein
MQLSLMIQMYLWITNQDLEKLYLYWV